MQFLQGSPNKKAGTAGYVILSKQGCSIQWNTLLPE